GADLHAPIAEAVHRERPEPRLHQARVMRLVVLSEQRPERYLLRVLVLVAARRRGVDRPPRRRKLPSGEERVAIRKWHAVIDHRSVARNDSAEARGFLRRAFEPGSSGTDHSAIARSSASR